ncbi:MAG TPA: sulfite exporter TauE/SafE family protein [Vicinamibacterales bacterium]|nr:sulfite exporter TauE/SafE family protein [Vicinamibacterales bacterium]
MDATALALIAAAGFFAGGVAAIVGFGIGSIFTPLLSVWIDARVAVAAISIPHLIGTAVRFYLLDGRVDRRVLWSFGIASAIGGISGALLNTVFSSPALLQLLAVLLLFVGVGELTGFSRRIVFRGAMAWIAGAISGLLGGIVGNQGGLRSAALLSFQMDRNTFVATVTAIGLMVDAARMPVYFVAYADELSKLVMPIAVATIATIVGTVIGGRLLRRIPESWFRRIVAVVLLVLGVALLLRD